MRFVASILLTLFASLVIAQTNPGLTFGGQKMILAILYAILLRVDISLLVIQEAMDLEVMIYF